MEKTDREGRAKKQSAYLTDRPCSVCKFKTQNGCSRWTCVFEEEPINTELCEDCISRQAAIKAMYDLCADGKDRIDNPWRDNPNIDAIIDAIENLPSIQPETKTGHWIYNENTLEYKCSECGRPIDTRRFERPYIRYPYCHCGAKMEEE